MIEKNLGNVLGPQGLQGIQGEVGKSVNIRGGVLTESELPDFETTEVNTAYVVKDSDKQFDLYIRGQEKQSDTQYWTIVENWQGIPGNSVHILLEPKDLTEELTITKEETEKYLTPFDCIQTGDIVLDTYGNIGSITIDSNQNYVLTKVAVDSIPWDMVTGKPTGVCSICTMSQEFTQLNVTVFNITNKPIDIMLDVEFTSENNNKLDKGTRLYDFDWYMFGDNMKLTFQPGISNEFTVADYEDLPAHSIFQPSWNGYFLPGPGFTLTVTFYDHETGEALLDDSGYELYQEFFFNNLSLTQMVDVPVLSGSSPYITYDGTLFELKESISIDIYKLKLHIPCLSEDQADKLHYWISHDTSYDGLTGINFEFYDESNNLIYSQIPVWENTVHGSEVVLIFHTSQKYQDQMGQLREQVGDFPIGSYFFLWPHKGMKIKSSFHMGAWNNWEVNQYINIETSIFYFNEWENLLQKPFETIDTSETSLLKIEENQLTASNSYSDIKNRPEGVSVDIRMDEYNDMFLTMYNMTDKPVDIVITPKCDRDIAFFGDMYWYNEMDGLKLTFEPGISDVCTYVVDGETYNTYSWFVFDFKYHRPKVSYEFTIDFYDHETGEPIQYVYDGVEAPYQQFFYFPILAFADLHDKPILASLPYLTLSTEPFEYEGEQVIWRDDLLLHIPCIDETTATYLAHYMSNRRNFNDGDDGIISFDFLANGKVVYEGMYSSTIHSDRTEVVVPFSITNIPSKYPDISGQIRDEVTGKYSNKSYLKWPYNNIQLKTSFPYKDSGFEVINTNISIESKVLYLDEWDKLKLKPFESVNTENGLAIVETENGKELKLQDNIYPLQWKNVDGRPDGVWVIFTNRYDAYNYPFIEFVVLNPTDNPIDVVMTSKMKYPFTKYADEILTNPDETITNDWGDYVDGKKLTYSPGIHSEYTCAEIDGDDEFYHFNQFTPLYYSCVDIPDCLGFTIDFSLYDHETGEELADQDGYKYFISYDYTGDSLPKLYTDTPYITIDKDPYIYEGKTYIFLDYLTLHVPSDNSKLFDWLQEHCYNDDADIFFKFYSEVPSYPYDNYVYGKVKAYDVSYNGNGDTTIKFNQVLDEAGNDITETLKSDWDTYYRPVIEWPYDTMIIRSDTFNAQGLINSYYFFDYSNVTLQSLLYKVGSARSVDDLCFGTYQDITSLNLFTCTTADIVVSKVFYTYNPTGIVLFKIDLDTELEIVVGDIYLSCNKKFETILSSFGTHRSGSVSTYLNIGSYAPGACVTLDYSMNKDTFISAPIYITAYVTPDWSIETA